MCITAAIESAVAIKAELTMIVCVAVVVVATEIEPIGDIRVGAKTMHRIDESGVALVPNGLAVCLVQAVVQYAQSRPAIRQMTPESWMRLREESALGSLCEVLFATRRRHRCCR